MLTKSTEVNERTRADSCRYVAMLVHTRDESICTAPAGTHNAAWNVIYLLITSSAMPWWTLLYAFRFHCIGN